MRAFRMQLLFTIFSIFSFSAFGLGMFSHETYAQTPKQQKKTDKEKPAASAKIYLSSPAIHFKDDTLEYAVGWEKALKAVVKILQPPNVSVEVEGHTDERDTNEQNMILGRRRAEKVKAELVKAGIASDKISVVSYGEDKPVDDGHDEKSWAKNARVEFLIAK